MTSKKVTITIEKRINFPTGGTRFEISKITNSREYLPGDDITDEQVDELIGRENVKVVITK